MKQLWIVVVEMSCPPDTFESKLTLAFVNWVTWGGSAEEAMARVRTASTNYGWQIIGSERIEPVDDSANYDEEILDLISRASLNPSAIVYGTFHCYPAH